jgi:hypothetical protein
LELKAKDIAILHERKGDSDILSLLHNQELLTCGKAVFCMVLAEQRKEYRSGVSASSSYAH